MRDTPDSIIYQLKVMLLDVRPMIWRCLLVRSDSTIVDLHFAQRVEDKEQAT